MRFNIGSTPTSSPSLTLSPQDQSALSIDNPKLPSNHPPISSSSSSSSSSRSGLAKCPVDHASLPKPSPTPKSQRPAKCPIQHDTPSTITTLNPLNSIPTNLTSERHHTQTIDLPKDRTSSSIPRPKGSESGYEGDTQEDEDGPTWDYPSPQQFYNALVRKGWETPEESVEVMVDIHNFLNEQAWEEVLKWERRLPGGDQCQLARFQGKPGTLSPKARFHLIAGKVFPSRFNTTPPFDRHDWLVTRHPDPSNPTPEGKITTRYVIDYYSAPPDENGYPVFSLDVRPALDSFESVSQRVKVGVEEWLGTGQ